MKLLHLLLILFIFKGIFWAILIPIWQAPDEPNHFANTQFTAETGKLYVGRFDKNLSQEIAQSAAFLNLDLDLNLTGRAPAPSWKPDFTQNLQGKFEADIKNIPTEERSNFVAVVGGVKSPPLYYIVSSIIYRIFAPLSLIDRVFLIRILSVILGAGVVWLTFLLTRELAREEKISFAASVLVAFHPTFNVISSTINPDIMLIFLTSVFLYFGVKILKNNEFSPKNLLPFFATLISGILVRFASLSLLPASAIVFLPRKIYLIVPGVILFFAGVLVFFRSPGLLGEFSQFFGNPANFSPASFLNFAIKSFPHYNGEVFSWYWAVFGWLEASLPIAVFRVLRVLTIISLAGLIILVFNWLKKPKLSQNSLAWIFIIGTILFTILLVVIFDWQTFVRTGVGFGVQGRHFLQAISAQMVLFLLGILTITTKLKINPRHVLLLVIFWFIFLNLLSIWVQAQFFYQTSQFSQFIVRASQYKPEFTKGAFFIFWLTMFFIFQITFIVKLLINFIKSK